jgi:ribosomal protein S18 acetylase RimI-like enzyme
MTEIRRIRDDDSEPEQAVELWDRDCREDPDGAPLSRVGRHNLERMLAMMAWHRDSFCLVAVRPDGRIVGYVCGHVETGDGLLPGAVGEINELYVTPEAPDAPDLPRRLVEAAVQRLRADAAVGIIRSTVDVQDEAHQALLAGLGFEADLVTLSLYPAE